MKITINDSAILLKISEDTGLSPSKLIESFVSALSFLYSTYNHSKNEGIEKRSFNEILANLLMQILHCTTDNLDVVPKLIEQTSRLLGIGRFLSASVQDIHLDFDKHAVSYSVVYTLCSDVANINVYPKLAFDVHINQEFIQFSHIDFIPLIDTMEITNSKIEILSDFVNSKLLNMNNKNIFETDSHSSALINRIRCTLSLIGPKPLNEFFMIKVVINVHRIGDLPPIEEITRINKEIRGLAVTELGLNT